MRSPCLPSTRRNPKWTKVTPDQMRLSVVTAQPALLAVPLARRRARFAASSLNASFRSLFRENDSLIAPNLISFPVCAHREFAA
jgi:hypothetical protein